MRSKRSKAWHRRKALQRVDAVLAPWYEQSSWGTPTHGQMKSWIDQALVNAQWTARYTRSTP